MVRIQEVRGSNPLISTRSNPSVYIGGLSVKFFLYMGV